VNPSYPGAEQIMREVAEAARTKGVQGQILKASTESEIDAAFAILAEQHADALVFSVDPFFASRREQLVALAARHAVLAIYFARDFTASGGVISYMNGASLTSVYRQAGFTPDGYSRVRSQPIFRSSSRPNSSWSSISRLLRRSALPCRKRFSPAPTR
jgi:hypothetical protein